MSLSVRNAAVTIALVALSAGQLLAPGEARAWGGTGHRVVAAIAASLAPEQAAQINALVAAQLEIDTTFVDAASYPDEWVRDHDDATRTHDSWHYVDWEVGTPIESVDCRPDCILRELPKQLELLRAAPSARDRALAAAWVLHLVGDLHQPLHVSDQNDDGGNKFRVRYRGRDRYHATYDDRDHSMQLHAVWDDFLVEDLAAGRSPQEIAMELLARTSDDDLRRESSGGIVEWAQQSHDLAAAVYDNLVPGQDLEDAYIGQAVPVVRLQLLRAGMRLAALLRDLNGR